ncbi:Short-chain dehydrogenase tic 32 protein [Thalictrum thalictroides]|uniref:Short-chain dehydrogenase tic 32 protein n=1 Tax=Thalictrum thalictroides TaxID=46969 RepID=A0A7J6VFD9_THATH|nr:Short-chain dehydrogenase tic 32 protein [Thalictrum thalictroides]
MSSMKSIWNVIIGKPGPSGFGSGSTAEEVTKEIDASNLTAIVTEGASGIGLETARVLLALRVRGAHVIIAARNMEAANNAKQLILKNNENARIDVLKLDLSSIKSVKAFVDNFDALDLPLNILMRGKVLDAHVDSLKAVMVDLKAEASFFDSTATEAADVMVDLKAEASFFDSTATEAAEGLVEIREHYTEKNPAERMSNLRGKNLYWLLTLLRIRSVLVLYGVSDGSFGYLI